jgi:hypothetical protein
MIIGTYSGGSASAYEYDNFQELLDQLPDNTGNQIDAINVRNSVYTLWERISDVQTIASQSASASVYYTNLTPTLVGLGGIPAGSTFSNKTMQEMWDALLYPYVPQIVSLSGGDTREFGAPNSTTLSWSFTKKSNNIVSAVITSSPGSVNYPIPGTPFSTSQSGTYPTTIVTNTDTTFTFTVNDGSQTVTATTNYKWLPAVYWGKATTNTLPSMVIPSGGTKPTWADGASVGSGKNLASSRNATYNGINGQGQYLLFAWPSSYGSPTFKVNGLTNTAFTKIGSAVPHTCMYNNYTQNYDIWISDTAQNSPIASFVIS